MDVCIYTTRDIRWKPESLSWKIPPSAVDTFSRVEPGVPVPDGVALELFNGHTYQVHERFIVIIGVAFARSRSRHFMLMRRIVLLYWPLCTRSCEY